MNKKYMLLAIITMLLLQLVTPITTVTYSQQPAYLRFLFLYVPGFSLEKAVNTSPLKYLENITFKAYINPMPPYTLSYNEIVLVNNSWDLSKAIVLDNNTALLPNNTYTQLYKLVPKQLLTNLWGTLDTMFLGLSSINPQVHNRTMNPYFNGTNKIIKPALFIIPINGTTKWDQLNTTIKLSVSTQYFVLSIENYVDSIKFSKETNVTPILKFNITNEKLSVEPGIYYLRFRVLKINNTHIILFTPGTRRADQWFSEYFEKFNRPVVPRISFKYIRYMEEDDLEWLINETISFYESMLTTAYKYRSARINFVEYPLIYDLWTGYMHGYINREQLSKLEKLAYNGLSEIINITKNMINENITTIIYSPFTLNDHGEDLSIQGLKYVEPGLYFVERDETSVLSELISRNISFTTISFGGKKLVLINNPEYYGVGKGELIVYGKELRKILSTFTLQPANVASFIASLVRGYSVGLSNAINEISFINLKIQSLNNEINNLEKQLNSLNQTLFNVNQSLGKCKAENINLTDQISSYEAKINEYKQREQQALLYATIGSIGVLVIVVLLYIIATRGITKKS